MQYNSFLYLFFFLPLAVFLYYLVPRKRRWYVLLAFSLLFYLLTGSYLIVVLVVQALVTWAAAVWISRRNDRFAAVKKQYEKAERKAKKAALNAGNSRITGAVVVFHLLVLFFCKYLNFADSIVNVILKIAGLSFRIPQFRLFIPLGISFYTLSAISYICDVNWGKYAAEHNFGKVFLFLSFFTNITEGPIERYDTTGFRLAEGSTFDYKTFCHGLQLIIWGLFQKIVIADRLNGPVGKIFSGYQSYSGWAILLGVVLYTFQLYMDFAGCIDIARGSAELFGIELSVNFRQPFASRTAGEFWRRWHISLGGFLRDYVFYPVSMSKLSRKLGKKWNRFPMLLSLGVVWFCCGLWHGSSFRYVAYGAYYFIILATGELIAPASGKVLEKLHISPDWRPYQWFQRARTFVLVNFGMMLFRADGFRAFLVMCRRILIPYREMGPMELLTKVNVGRMEILFYLFMILILIVTGAMKEQGKTIRDEIDRLPLPVRWGIYLAGIAFVVVYGAYGAGFGAVDFIYAQF